MILDIATGLKWRKETVENWTFHKTIGSKSRAAWDSWLPRTLALWWNYTTKSMKSSKFIKGWTTRRWSSSSSRLIIRIRSKMSIQGKYGLMSLKPKLSTPRQRRARIKSQTSSPWTSSFRFVPTIVRKSCYTSMRKSRLLVFATMPWPRILSKTWSKSAFKLPSLKWIATAWLSCLSWTWS